jgi:hypothetical protein
MIECRAAFIRNIFVSPQRKKRLFSAAAHVCITRECGAQLAANVIILRVVAQRTPCWPWRTQNSTGALSLWTRALCALRDGRRRPANVIITPAALIDALPPVLLQLTAPPWQTAESNQFIILLCIR